MEDQLISTNQFESTLGHCYAEPHRAYHNLAHIQALLQLLDRHAAPAQDKDLITAAIWFHDAIYDPMRSDNEELSAQLAEQLLAQWQAPADWLQRVPAMVGATQGHTWSDGHSDTALFLDLDLSILAAPEDRYEQYTQQIEQEYAWVPQPIYSIKRAEVLRSFLNRSTLYFTQALRDAWEPLARRNLQLELDRLAAASQA